MKKGQHQIPHTRVSSRGKPFIAGKGKPSPKLFRRKYTQVEKRTLGKKSEDVVAEYFRSIGFNVKDVSEMNKGIGDLHLRGYKSILVDDTFGKTWLIEVKSCEEWIREGDRIRRGKIHVNINEHPTFISNAYKYKAIPMYVVVIRTEKGDILKAMPPRTIDMKMSESKAAKILTIRHKELMKLPSIKVWK